MLVDSSPRSFRNIREVIKKNFKFATLSFIFILVYVNLFQLIFGPENSIVGVIFAILMSSSMARDMTRNPVKHLLIQAFATTSMAVCACLVTILPPVWALGINFIMIFIILYSYTYEYSSHLYFPYILSYLFLVFIAPITPVQLPKRILAMLIGAVSVILYQLVMGHTRMADTTKDALTTIIQEACQYIEWLLHGQSKPDDMETVRSNLCKLNRLVYECRKSVLRVSDASFAMIDCGRGLEHLILLLREMSAPLTPCQIRLLEQTKEELAAFRTFVETEGKTLKPLSPSSMVQENQPEEKEFFLALTYIREHLLRMTDPEKRNSYCKSMLSLWVRLKAAMDISTVRIVYALRVACLLSVFTLLVQVFHLPHGRWLLFTIASVSLPYADDVGSKAKKRLAATIVGGILGTAAYALFPDPIVRTIIMMLSGYLSFYFTDYTAIFACSTIGALGGSIVTSAFGWGAVSQVLAIRLGYILLGVVIALIGNCLIFPFHRGLATHKLWEKYSLTADLLTRICQNGSGDTQLYYNLVIQSHLQEDKLCQNLTLSGKETKKPLLEQYRTQIRNAHRKRVFG